jgi:DNA polymerase III epsilon subunit family exonuclease
MKLFKKCILCNRSGILLHLENNLCPSCIENLNNLKLKRKELFNKIEHLSIYMEDNISDLENVLTELNKYYLLGINLEDSPKEELDDLTSKKENLILLSNIQKEINTIKFNCSNEVIEKSIEIMKNKYIPILKEYQTSSSSLSSMSIPNLEIFINDAEKKLIQKKKRKEKAHNDTINYIAFDFETTGLSPINSEILEIGAVKVLNGQIADTFQTLIKPKKKITSRITKINNITNEMVENERSIEEILPGFINFIEKYPLVAHNAEFDYSFLCENYERIYNKTFKRKKTCTMKLYRKVYKEDNGEKPDSSTLESCVVDLLPKKDRDEYFSSAHRALTDAIMAHKIYESLK